VINDNGGTAIPSDFTMYVSSDYLWQSFPGSETGTNVTVYEGSYNVGEYSRWDYPYSYSGDCSGFIRGGEVKTCTITNDDIPPAYLIVTKHVINDNGGTASSSDFTMYVNGNSPIPYSFQGSENGTNVTIYEGYYNIWEYSRSDYSQSNSNDCSGYISGGETKTCTITNDDVPPAHLIVTKHVINDNSGTANASDFTMYVNGNNPIPYSFQGSETGTDVTIYPGWYNAYENYYPQYNSFSSGDCNAYINSGETRTCTITNDDIY